MASTYYGINRGEPVEKVETAAATNGSDVEIRVDTSKVVSRIDLLVALGNLQQSILEQNYPAA